MFKVHYIVMFNSLFIQEKYFSASIVTSLIF